MATAFPASPYSPLTTSCEILTGGKRYFDYLLDIIDSSQKVLHLQVYIFNHDTTGLQVQEALIKASLRGVQVSLVLDGIGSGHLPKGFLNRFLEAGIEVRFFSKVHFRIPLRMGRRLHHKLVVADQQRAMIGGINIADRYRGSETEKPWLDYAVYLEGGICVDLHHLAAKILKKRDTKLLKQARADGSIKPTSCINARLLENDFFGKKLQVRKSYYAAILKAKDTIILFASYFLPSLKLMRLLEKASARGVKVSIVLPEKTDVLFYQTAVKYLYKRMLKNGISIYEYTATVLHAKVAVIDGEWCSIGSYNLNDLSDLLSIELNVEIVDRSIVQPFQQQLRTIIVQDCREVEGKVYNRVFLLQRLLSSIYYFGVLQAIKLLYWLTDKKKDYPIE